MPYESAINDSDIALREQLDQAKLGSGSMSSNPSVVADAAWATLPEEMALQNVMRSRAALGLETMRMGRFIADDKKLQREADEFDSFSKELQGLNPGDIEGNARVLSSLSQRYAGNKEVQDAINNASQNDLRVMNARKSAFESRTDEDAMKAYDAHKKANDDLYDLEINNRLKKAEIDQKNFSYTMADNGMIDHQKRGEAIASFAGRHKELAELASGFAIDARDSGLGDEGIRKVDGLLALFAKTQTLEEVDEIKLKKTAEVFDAVTRTAKVDLRTLPPDQAEAAISKMPPAMQVAAREALADHTNYRASSSERAAIGDQLTELLKRAPKPGDEEGKRQFEKQLEVLAMKAAGFGKKVDMREGEIKREMSEKERIRNANKEMVDIAAKVQGMEASKARIQIQKEMLRMEKEGLTDKAMFDAWRMADKTELFKKVKTFEQFVDMRNQFKKEFAAEGTGTDRYNTPE